MAIVIRGVDHPALTDDEDVVVVIMGTVEAKRLESALDALTDTPWLMTTHWPCLRSFKDALVGDGDA